VSSARPPTPNINPRKAIAESRLGIIKKLFLTPTTQRLKMGRRTVKAKIDPDMLDLFRSGS
jgi:hypothetical protein